METELKDVVLKDVELIEAELVDVELVEAELIDAGLPPTFLSASSVFSPESAGGRAGSPAGILSSGNPGPMRASSG